MQTYLHHNAAPDEPVPEVTFDGEDNSIPLIRFNTGTPPLSIHLTDLGPGLADWCREFAFALNRLADEVDVRTIEALDRSTS